MGCEEEKLINSKAILQNVFGNMSVANIIAGPCSVENYEMMEKIIQYLVSKGISTIRAGAFKPRTSPSNFQGLGLMGLEILDTLRKKYDVKIVSEIVDVRNIDEMQATVDILQIGSRNMYNYELLKELGKSQVPVILKRGISATLNEFISAASYVSLGGNRNIILCERGIRSFDTETRNLLDLASVALLKKEYNYPVIIDISHSLGRKDIALPMARAALVAGGDGIMVEVHNNPVIAQSDSKQQMDFSEFNEFLFRLHE